MASKFEETEKRRQEIASKRDADIETKKGKEDESPDQNLLEHKKPLPDQKDEILLHDLAMKMTKNRKLKYAYDRQGKLGMRLIRK